MALSQVVARNPAEVKVDEICTFQPLFQLFLSKNYEASQMFSKGYFCFFVLVSPIEIKQRRQNNSKDLI